MSCFVARKHEDSGGLQYYGGTNGKTGHAVTVGKNNAPIFDNAMAKTIVAQLEKVDNRGWFVLDPEKP